MLSPKIHRYSMLPARCRMPPCTNIEVSSVSGAGIAVCAQVEGDSNRLGVTASFCTKPM